MLAYSTGKVPIGNDDEADLAARGDLTEVGSGLFKRVYVSRDGTCVYKVARDARPGSDQSDVNGGRANALVAEAAWVKLGRKNRTPGIPHVTLYVASNGKPVLAMPYFPVDGDDMYGTRWSGRVSRALDHWYRLGMEDLHPGNYRADANGKVWVVDLGGWGNGAPDTLPADVIRMCTADVSDLDEQDMEDGYGDDHEDCTCDECRERGHDEGWCAGRGVCGLCDDAAQDEHDNGDCDPDACAFTHEVDSHNPRDCESCKEWREKRGLGWVSRV